MVAGPATVAAVLVMIASVVVLLVAPAADSQCDPLRDVVVKESAGDIQLDGAKKYGVTVSNQAGAAVSAVHLACAYDFRHVDDDVDPRVLVQVAHGDCLLVRGRAIAHMHVIAATCATVIT
ncbi:unnamed protein product [Miscanthus lutarioriparius]|uniref:Uncharacterized protein n=1 Tax=Miscanthus lutarioriparius TaxID=422564 RepID=A0A811QE29_9POAL|nr:unnamed protein product [Miscanthus lutarioriparius]